jgi:dihydrofolate reductase
MPKVRLAGFSISLDGFGAGPDQSLEHPLGKRGEELHQWFFGTRTFREMTGEGGGSDGVDEAYAHRSMDGFGAFILGRNMFGPNRGVWPDDNWKGWWGADPPYHAPTFVLTHHPRDPIEMEGGTTFIFVTNGIEAALEQAKIAAKGRDVKIGGGVETVRQYLRAGLIDELHLAVSRSCWAKAKRCSPESTCRRSATASPSIRRRNTRRTSSSTASSRAGRRERGSHKVPLRTIACWTSVRE